LLPPGLTFSVTHVEDEGRSKGRVELDSLRRLEGVFDGEDDRLAVLVLDLNQFGRFDGLRPRLGHHQADGLSRMPHFTRTEHLLVLFYIETASSHSEQVAQLVITGVDERDETVRFLAPIPFKRPNKTKQSKRSDQVPH